METKNKLKIFLEIIWIGFSPELPNFVTLFYIYFILHEWETQSASITTLESNRKMNLGHTPHFRSYLREDDEEGVA